MRPVQWWSSAWLPVGGVADLLVVLQLVAHHLQELIGVRDQVLHQGHQVLNGLLHDHSVLQNQQTDGFRHCTAPMEHFSHFAALKFEIITLFTALILRIKLYSATDWEKDIQNACKSL